MRLKLASFETINLYLTAKLCRMKGILGVLKCKQFLMSVLCLFNPWLCQVYVCLCNLLYRWPWEKWLEGVFWRIIFATQTNNLRYWLFFKCILLFDRRLQGNYAQPLLTWYLLNSIEIRQKYPEINPLMQWGLTAVCWTWPFIQCWACHQFLICFLQICQTFHGYTMSRPW